MLRDKYLRRPLTASGRLLQPKLRSGETMKKTQRLCAVSLFILVLTTATFAGDIDTPKAPQPPPAGSLAKGPGDIHTGREMQNPQGTSESVAGVALSLLQTMLSVF
jgi:hypothetical protein